MHEAEQLRRRVIRGLLTSVYHGDQGVAGLLLLKHRILLGVLKNGISRNTWANIFY